MKKRTFYIVNLDRNRIMLLSVLLTGFILLAFATGYRFGHTPDDTGGGNQAGKSNTGFSGSLKGHSAARGLNGDNGNRTGSEKKPAPGDSSRYGKSIYSLKKGSSGNGDNTRASGSMRRDFNDGRDINGSISMSENRERVQPRDKSAEIARKKRREREAARRAEKRREIARREAERRRVENRKRIAARKEAARRKREREQRIAARRKREAETRRRRESADRRTALLRTRGETSRSFRNTASKRAYTVQVGAYRMKRSATRIASTLKRKGFGARVRRHRGHYFVMVGRAGSKNELRGLTRRLRQEKYPSFIIPAK